MATKYAPSDPLSVGDVTKPISEWAVDRGCPVQTLLSRLNRGWSPERTVSEAISSQGGANKGQKADADVLVVDEVERLLEAGSRNETWPRDRALIVLAYRSGLRCAEILALLPKDLDVARGTVSVHHGKGDKARVVALDPMAWAQLAEWMQLRATWSIEESSPLFCTRHGGPINSRQVRAMFARRSRKAKIDKHAHPHAMRRTMASEMAAEGIPLIDISGALGHSNVATTNTYLKKVNPTSVIEAMRSRDWKSNSNGRMTSTKSTLPPPDWLTRLINDIGDRLMACHDARSSEADFKAIVLLF